MNRFQYFKAAVLFSVLALPLSALANPDPRWEKDYKKNLKKSRNDFIESERTFLPPSKIGKNLSRSLLREMSTKVIRVQFNWDPNTGKFDFAGAEIEYSGTKALQARSQNRNPLGSFHGVALDLETKKTLAYDSVGTGYLYQQLTRSISFRFPYHEGRMGVVLKGEDPKTGEIKKLTQVELLPSQLQEAPERKVEVRLLQTSDAPRKLIVPIYSDGLALSDKSRFFSAAQKVVDQFKEYQMPGLERMEFIAVFAPSKEKLKKQDLGPTPIKKDSFLGLDHPYWEQFGRWYHVVYPTSERHFRIGLGQVPYDYPIVLIDSDEYWGVGNFNALTAVPVTSTGEVDAYLLLHEFGHYFGLNEEYDTGGPTELNFAIGIEEPWSQNITFHPAPFHDLKWRQFVSESTPLPTPPLYWAGKKYGAYRGGYAESESHLPSHKPGLNCVMGTRNRQFCPICTHAIQEKIKFDLGKP